MPAFYSLSEVERIAVTEKALAERRTIHERWQALAEPEAEAWSARSQLAAEWIVGERGVLDLGCGTMAFERYLPE